MNAPHALEQELVMHAKIVNIVPVVLKMVKPAQFVNKIKKMIIQI